ncbi:hypothetical protein M404DRAFT_140722, partial [Pisolithus tinctorius Marx 270]
PAAVAEIALAVQLERLRVTEALAARDNVVVRLEDAYTSVRQKSATISRLERELEILRRSSTPSFSNPSALQESERIYAANPQGPSATLAQITLSSLLLDGSAEKTVAARHSILAALPLPSGIPADELQPIVLPHSYSLGDFLRNTTGVRNYRILTQATTYWCPDREEHGYFLTPVFKCTTNPRVVTAHRWSPVDVLGHMREPTECFYHKDGKWYYAGTYKAFRMDDLTTQEWELLSTETTQAIIKETLAGRKNVSPQNTYEASQLYAAGALKVSCVGLQCIGFNHKVYHAVLEQSRFVHWTRSSGRTTSTPPTSRRHADNSDDGKSSIN